MSLKQVSLRLRLAQEEKMLLSNQTSSNSTSPFLSSRGRVVWRAPWSMGVVLHLETIVIALNALIKAGRSLRAVSLRITSLHEFNSFYRRGVWQNDMTHNITSLQFDWFFICKLLFYRKQ